MTVPTQQRAPTGQFDPDKFIDALRAAGLKPRDLAEEMSCSLEAVARWMAGIASPKPGYASYAAEVLGVDVADLYE